MLSLYSGGNQYPIQYDDYYIRQLASGLDEGAQCLYLG